MNVHFSGESVLIFIISKRTFDPLKNKKFLALGKKPVG